MYMYMYMYGHFLEQHIAYGTHRNLSKCCDCVHEFYWPVFSYKNCHFQKDVSNLSNGTI